MEIQLERTQLTGRPMANEVGKKKDWQGEG